MNRPLSSSSQTTDLDIASIRDVNDGLYPRISKPDFGGRVLKDNIQVIGVVEDFFCLGVDLLVGEEDICVAFADSLPEG